MKIYLIRQNKVDGYDTYDSAIVSAINEQDARNIHPSEFVTHVTDDKWMGTYSAGARKGEEYKNETSTWVRYIDIDCIEVEYIGETKRPRGLILASLMFFKP